MQAKSPCIPGLTVYIDTYKSSYLVVGGFQFPGQELMNYQGQRPFGRDAGLIIYAACCT
jgi:hypothetical protein